MRENSNKTKKVMTIYQLGCHVLKARHPKWKLNRKDLYDTIWINKESNRPF